ncbi:HAD family hydrolase [Pandoraea commovens]|uniref:HAD family hydrolase n=1 Tax=Pandoraea commovens TaxID=2508289 RepID=A0ABY5QHJ1_9BURK|nr:HAD family hydrolase [Pandoraea commovens]UVA79995.1 HAD family hydrolase [Pandoraea commovens]
MRAVIFDLFGTLVEIKTPRYPYRKLLRWIRQSGTSLTPDDAKRIMSQPVSLADAAELFGAAPPAAQLAAWETDLQTELSAMCVFPDTLPALARLRSTGYCIGLCSNLAAPYAAPAKALLPELDVYAWSFQIGAIKPDPQVYEYLVYELQCRPSDILFIGDSLHADFDGPSEFGMKARLLNRTGNGTLLELLEAAL